MAPSSSMSASRPVSIRLNRKNFWGGVVVAVCDEATHMEEFSTFVTHLSAAKPVSITRLISHTGFRMPANHCWSAMTLTGLGKR